MALTKDQARQAGIIAAQMELVETGIANIQAAIDAGLVLENVLAETRSPSGDVAAPLQFHGVLGAKASAAIMAEWLSVLQTALSDLTAQLP